MIKLHLLTFIISMTFISSDEARNLYEWPRVQWRSDEPGFWADRIIQPKVVPSSKFDKGGRIVGGWEVEPHTHPYQAGLMLTRGNSLLLCGGSAIHLRAILTAAHCTDLTEHAQVVLGAHRLQSLELTQQRFNVTLRGYRPHPLYNRRNFQNDICILLLDSPIELTPYVQLIALPRSSELRQRSFAGEIATVRLV